MARALPITGCLRVICRSEVISLSQWFRDPAKFTAGTLRASTRESSSGWMYLATARPAGFYRFRPSDGTLEQLGTLPGYTATLLLDPSERYVYYMPYAHGSAYEYGAPVYRFDIRTGQHEVIASINESVKCPPPGFGVREAWVASPWNSMTSISSRRVSISRCGSTGRQSASMRRMRRVTSLASPRCRRKSDQCWEAISCELICR